MGIKWVVGSYKLTYAYIDLLYFVHSCTSFILFKIYASTLNYKKQHIKSDMIRSSLQKGKVISLSNARWKLWLVIARELNPKTEISYGVLRSALQV